MRFYLTMGKGVKMYYISMYFLVPIMKKGFSASKMNLILVTDLPRRYTIISMAVQFEQNVVSYLERREPQM